MTGRLARTFSSVAAAALTAACASYSEIPIETPIRPTMDVSAFQRVLVAGFISGGSEDVDGNLETTTDFRRVYATLIQEWMGVDAAAVLGMKQETLKVFRG